LIYAGFAWNRASSADILSIDLRAGESRPVVPEHYGQLLRQVFKTYLLAPSSSSSKTPDTVISMLLDILSGNISALIDPNDSSYAPVAQPLTMTSFFFTSYTPSIPLADEHQPVKAEQTSTGQSSLSSSEMRIWPISISAAYLSNAIAISKLESSRCLRVYRRIINTVGWKPTSGAGKLLADVAADMNSNARHSKIQALLDSLPHSLDMEEYFATIHLHSILAKAVIYGYNMQEKSVTPRKSKSSENVAAVTTAAGSTIDGLIKLLPPGTKSDIANSLLESIEHVSIIWRKKYDRVNTIISSSSQTSKSETFIVDQWLLSRLEQNDRSLQDDQILAFMRARFLLESPQTIPASPVFNRITEGLLMPKSIEDVLKHFFD
jgi:hypothetical protein